MRKLVSVVHTSLDGFVAGLNGELDGFDAGEENLEFVCRLTEGADAALFGRVSYELLNSYWPTAKDRPGATGAEIRYSNWYNKAYKIVMSHTMKNVGIADTTVIGENLRAELLTIREQPGKDILLFGSPAASQSLMRLDLIDSYWIFINPVIFGSGIPFFADVNQQMKLILTESKVFPNGEIALHYVVKRDQA
jgi:dihydrofolate reductase